tara:strand:- start:376 stop:3432 length:3057 start_codon:yes stop_codon:yes gene_type:complete
MIELQVRNGDFYDWFPLELSEGAAIPLTYSFADPEKLMSREAPYSGTFLLPFSNLNNDFFENYFMIDLSQGSWSTDIFRPENPVQCTLLNDGVSLIEGVLQLISVSKTGQTYECAISGGAGDLFTQMGNTKLRDVFSNSSLYNYENNAANVIASWTGDITDGNVGDGVIRIPLVDKALSEGGRLYGNNGVDEGLFSTNYLPPSHLLPFMQIDHIFRTILTNFGFSLSSTFMSTTVWTNLYMSLGNGANGLKTTPYYGFKAGLSTDLTIPQSTYTAILPFDTTSLTGLYDPDNNYDESSFAFVVPSDMYAVFDFSFFVNIDNLIDQGELFITLTDSGTTLAEFSWTFQAGFTNVSNPFTFTMPQSVFLENANDIQVIITTHNMMNCVVLSNSEKTFWRFLSYESTVISGEPVDTIANMPDITCSAFVKDLVQRYNLTLLPSTSPQELILEPLSDYIASGDVLDWSEKLDHSQPFIVKPATELRSKDIIFNDGVDKDWPNQYQFNEYGTPLGQYAFRSNDTYAVGKHQNSSVFGATAIQQLPTADWNSVDANTIIYPRLFGESNGAQIPVAHKPKILYWNGTQSTGGDSIYISETETSIYGCVTPFHTLPITDTTQSTYWRHTLKQAAGSPLIGQNYSLGLAKTYWSEYLQQIYTEDARLIECQIAITPADMNLLTFDDRIFIDGIYYRVIEISGYNPVNPKPTPVRLMKLIDIGSITLFPSEQCDLTYISSNIDGTTNWIDTFGVSQNPTSTCCEAEGLTYALDGVTPECWWNWQSDGEDGDPTDGFENGGGSGKGSGVSGIPTRSFFPQVPIPIGSQQGTHLLRQSSKNFDMAWSQNGTASYVKNTLNEGMASSMAFQLLCVTNSTTAVVAGVGGKLISDLIIPINTTAHFKINALGVIYAASTLPIGGTYFVSQSIVLKNISGVISTISDTVVESNRDTGLAAPTVSIAYAGASKRDFVLDLSVTGEDDVNTSWVLDVNVTYMNMSNTAAILNNGLMTEANDFFVLENTTKLVTEQT